MKKWVSFFVAVTLLMVCTMRAWAVSFEPNTTRSSVNYRIDNDTIDSRYRNERYGFSTYYEGAQHYNGDARRTASVNKNHHYQWLGPRFDTPNKKIYLTMGTHLNSSLFTDTKARYWSIQGFEMFLIGTKNQNTAPAGWSYMNGVLDRTYEGPGMRLDGICLMPSGTGSGYTGADAISVYAYD